jgi:hypothetical protein
MGLGDDMRKMVSWLVLSAFLLSGINPPGVLSQTIAGAGFMPEPGTLVSVSQVFKPAHLMGIVIDQKNALKFDFLIDRGDKAFSADEKSAEYKKLIKYFLAAMTIPDKDQWVNLSPYEEDRIIQNNFGLTEC